MSPICVVFFLMLVLAINVSALATSGKSADQVPADIADLEAAVQAKYHLQESPEEAKAKGEVAHIGESRPTSDLSDKSDATPDVPHDVAELEAAVHEKYHTFIEFMQGESQDLQSPVLETAKMAGDASELSQEARQESDAKTPSARGEAEGKVEGKAEEPIDVVQLEGAVQANYDSAVTKPKLGMSAKLEASSDDVSELEAAVQKKYNVFIDKMKSGSPAPQTPALELSKTKEGASRRSLKAARQLNESKSNVTEQAGAKPKAELSEVEALEAAVQAKFQLKIPSTKAQQKPIPQDIALKATIEGPSDVADAAMQANYSAEVISSNPQQELPTASLATNKSKPGARLKLKVETSTDLLSSLAKPEGETSQKVVTRDSVKLAPQRNTSNASSKASVHESAIKEHVDELAAKRAEVENYFHLSKASASNSSGTPMTVQPEVPVSAGSSMVSFVVFLAAILTFIGVAYHKYEVILQIQHSGKQGSRIVKAKQEDMYNVESGGSVPLSNGIQRNDENHGWSSSRNLILSAQSECRGLVRRTTAQPTRVIDSAV